MLKHFLFFFFLFFFNFNFLILIFFLQALKHKMTAKKNIEMLPCLVHCDTENRFVLLELCFRIVLDEYYLAA